MSDLEDHEIDAICAGLVQNAAKVRYLQRMGLTVRRKPNGKPLVNRAHAEQVLRPADADFVIDETMMAVERVPFKQSPLAAWQVEQRAIAEARRAAIDSLPRPPVEDPLARKARSAKARAALVRFHAAKRRVTKLQRTPAWADQSQIREIYARAKAISDATGIPHHVDHVIPLQGKRVSGLHVHNNLQVLAGSENSRKHNRFEVGE